MKTKMYPDLKCPKCGSDRIHSEDIYDIETVEVDGEMGLSELGIGVCRNCGTYFQWEQVYKFVGFRNITTVEDIIKGAD